MMGGEYLSDAELYQEVKDQRTREYALAEQRKAEEERRAAARLDDTIKYEWCTLDPLTGRYIPANSEPPKSDLEKAAPELLEALKELLSSVEELSAQSDGVAGYHLNGDLAEWADLMDDGAFYQVIDLKSARDAIAKAEGRRDE